MPLSSSIKFLLLKYRKWQSEVGLRRKVSLYCKPNPDPTEKSRRHGSQLRVDGASYSWIGMCLISRQCEHFIKCREQDNRLDCFQRVPRGRIIFRATPEKPTIRFFAYEFLVLIRLFVACITTRVRCWLGSPPATIHTIWTIAHQHQLQSLLISVNKEQVSDKGITNLWSRNDETLSIKIMTWFVITATSHRIYCLLSVGGCDRYSLGAKRDRRAQWQHIERSSLLILQCTWTYADDTTVPTVPQLDGRGSVHSPLWAFLPTVSHWGYMIYSIANVIPTRSTFAALV